MIKIVSDSSSIYSIRTGQEKGVDIAPLSVTINNKSYKEYEEINTKEFIEIINQGHIPVSSQPAIGEVLEIYKKYPEDEIINICMADGLSGTYNSACMARNMDENPERITVINSETLCGPQKYLVDLALKLVESGNTKEEIIEAIRETMKTSKSYLMPNDFDYLVRGGRLSPLVGKIGSMIKLVPVLTLSEDSKTLVKFATKRTLKKAIQKICEQLKADNVDGNYKIFVSHACAEELAQTAKNIILEHIEGADIEIKLLGPAFTTQGGPSCVAVQTVKKHEGLK